MIEVLTKGFSMARKNWDKIATAEFKALDSDWQADWADLRERTAGHR